MKRLIQMAALAAGLGGGIALADPRIEEGRPIPLETVDQIIEHNDRAVQHCGRSHHGIHAVMLRLQIDAAGRVESAVPVARATPETQCLARVAKRFTFPSTGVTSHVDYPFVLAPRR